MSLNGVLFRAAKETSVAFWWYWNKLKLIISPTSFDEGVCIDLKYYNTACADQINTLETARHALTTPQWKLIDIIAWTVRAKENIQFSAIFGGGCQVKCRFSNFSRFRKKQGASGPWGLFGQNMKKSKISWVSSYFWYLEELSVLSLRAFQVTSLFHVNEFLFSFRERWWALGSKCSRW